MPGRLVREDQPLHVAHGGAFGDDAILVTIHGTLTHVADFELAIEVSDGDEWIAPIGGNIDGQLQVLFLFSKDVTPATEWRVLHPEEWVFADGQPMVGAMSGTIE